MDVGKRSSMRMLPSLPALFFALSGAAAEPTSQLPPGFLIEEVARGLTGAVALAVAPDGRVFICEQTGALRLVRDGRLLAEPFLTLEVDSAWERGLIGVALDPRFPERPFVYLNHVVPRPHPHHRISR